MQLTLNRQEEKTGLFGRKIVFTLFVHVAMSEEELYSIRKHKLEKELVYEPPHDEPWNEVMVKDLVAGKLIKFPTLLDLSEAEEMIAERCKTLKNYLEVAQDSKKQTVVEI